MIVSILLETNSFSAIKYVSFAKSSSRFDDAPILVLSFAKLYIFLYKQMVVQSNMMAFVDAFTIIALIAFLLIPLPFLMKINIKEK